jgi:hypothetical protein
VLSEETACPRAGSIDDDGGSRAEGASGEPVSQDEHRGAGIRGNDAFHFHMERHSSSGLHRRDSRLDHQPSVIDGAIEVDYRAAQPLSSKTRLQEERLGSAERAGAWKPVPASQEIVKSNSEAQCCPPHSRGAQRREKEFCRVHQVRGHRHQGGPLLESFPDEAKLESLEVAQSAVDEPGGSRRSSGGQISTVHQTDIQSAKRGIPRHGAAGGPSSDHQEIKDLLAQGLEVALPIP